MHQQVNLVIGVPMYHVPAVYNSTRGPDTTNLLESASSGVQTQLPICKLEVECMHSCRHSTHVKSDDVVNPPVYIHRESQ